MEKKEYTKPTLKCVEFKVEMGFAMSQGVRGFGLTVNDYLLDLETDPDAQRNPFGGFFTGDNSDWD